MGNALVVEERLRAVMHSWLLPIAPGCEQQLATLIQTAAKRLESNGDAAIQSKVAESEHNLRHLLTEMTREAGAQGFNELHESTLSSALSRLCPIYPFC